MATKKKTKRRYNFSRRFRTHSRPKMTIPITVVAGFVPGVTYLYSQRGAGLAQVGNEAGRIYTGYDANQKKWSASNLRQGAIPVLIGMLAHKIANMTGVNAMLSRNRIPLIRI